MAGGNDAVGITLVRRIFYRMYPHIAYLCDLKRDRAPWLRTLNFSGWAHVVFVILDVGEEALVCHDNIGVKTVHFFPTLPGDNWRVHMVTVPPHSLREKDFIVLEARPLSGSIAESCTGRLWLTTHQ